MKCVKYEHSAWLPITRLVFLNLDLVERRSLHPISAFSDDWHRVIGLQIQQNLCDINHNKSPPLENIFIL